MNSLTKGTNLEEAGGGHGSYLGEGSGLRVSNFNCCQGDKVVF